jgi:hypothetical protein
LYLIFVLKLLDSYSYFSLSRSLTLLLTEEFEVSDYNAGTRLLPPPPRATRPAALTDSMSWVPLMA